MKKRLIYICLAVLITLQSIPFTAFAATVSLILEYDGAVREYSAESVYLYINNEYITGFGADMPPIILNDRLYVPVRDVFEKLGAVVDWNNDAKQTYIGYGDTLVALKNDSTYVNVDGVMREIPLAPKIVNGRTMVPVSFIAEIFGFSVDWNSDTRTAQINSAADNTSTDSVGHTEDETGTETAIDINAPSGPQTLEPAIDVSPAPLTEENHPDTRITEILFDASDPRTFYINASSQISKVEKFLLYDNRLVIDFYGAEMALPQTTYTTENSHFMSRVRAGQNQITPVKITRVVFDLTSSVNYSVSFSSDRKSVVVAFIQNEIRSVGLFSDGTGDSIVISGNITPVVNIFPSADSRTLVMDIPLGQLSSASLPVTTSGNAAFVSYIDVAQVDSSTARITVALKEPVSYTLSSGENNVVIRLTKPTYHNISYNSATRTLVIPKNGVIDLNLGDVVESDEYLSYKYTVTLPGDYSAHLGQGDYVIKDGFINSINISTNTSSAGARTSITFHQLKVLAYALYEDASYIYITAMLPKQKYDKIVIIDPGHGGSHPGAMWNGITEKVLTLEISSRINALLANSGVKVYMTRISDTFVTREDRAAFANEVGDLFVSVHLNSHDTTGPHGTEVYYYPHENDDELGFTSKQAAEILQRNLVNTLGSYDRKIKTNSFVVLVDTEIPAALCEIGFISNAAEAAKIKTSEYRQKAAEAIYRSIIEIFDIYSPKR